MGLRNPPDTLFKFLSRYDGFYLISHEEPDGDAIGSQLALASFLKRIGKTVVLLSSGPWQRKEISAYQELFHDTVSLEELNPAFGVLLLDCSSMERTGNFVKVLESLPLAVIDHHQQNGKLKGQVQYIEPNAPSTSILIQKIIESFSQTPTLEEARLLFLGFATDTGFFRHLEVEPQESLQLISRLTSHTVTPKSIYNEIFGNYSFESRKYLGAILSSLECYFDGRLLITHIRWENYQQYDKENRQSDPLYQLLLSIEGSEVIAFIREEEPGKTSVSLRSPSTTNVALIAQKLGGGGHKNAAGYITPLTYPEAKAQLLEQLRKLFQVESLGKP